MPDATIPPTEQIGEACEKVVSDYRSSKVTLEEAISVITDTIPFDPENPKAHGDALGAYIRMLYKHDVEKATASRAGALFTGGVIPPVPAGTIPDEPEPRDSDSATAPVRVNAESALATAPWVVASQLSTRILSPSLQTTAKFLADSRRFLTQYQASILSTPGRPALPDSEWTNVLCGRAVDLDKVLASQVGAIVQETRTRIADAPDFEIVQRNGSSASSRKVCDASDWFSAWEPARAATVFVFPHRRKELDDWTRYISNMFTASARTTDAQRRIIDFDKCVRIMVAQRGDIELTDIHDFEFKRLELQCLHTPSAASHTEPRSGAGPARTQKRKQHNTEPCRRFNSGHQHDASTCKYAHTCDGCGGSEPRSKCTKCKGRT